MFFTTSQPTAPMPFPGQQADAGIFVQFPVTQQPPPPMLAFRQPGFRQAHASAQYPQQPNQQQVAFLPPAHSQGPMFVTSQQPPPFMMHQNHQPVFAQQQPPAASSQQPSKKLVYVPVLIDDEPNNSTPQPVVTNQFNVTSPAPQPTFQYQPPMVQQFAPMAHFEAFPPSQNEFHMLHPTADPFKRNNAIPKSGQSLAATGFVARDARSLDPAQTPTVKPPSKQVQQAEPNVKLNFSQICRHFVLGSCNRKLCRFRHPAGEELESLMKLSPEELVEATNEARPLTGGAVPPPSPPPPSENGASDCASWLDSREFELGIQNLLRDLK
jgi:hypothetical protein